MRKTWLQGVPIDVDRTTHYLYRTTVLYGAGPSPHALILAIYTHYLCGGHLDRDPDEPAPPCEGAATCLRCAARWNGRG